MAMVLWSAPPFIMSALDRGPELRQLPRRTYEVSFASEGQNFVLRFDNVVAFKGTHLALLTAAMIEQSYGRVVDLGRTDWLLDGAKRAPELKLRHLQTCFDDGPCFEFLCDGFSANDHP